jgi:hypothetical protein
METLQQQFPPAIPTGSEMNMKKLSAQFSNNADDENGEKMMNVADDFPLL